MKFFEVFEDDREIDRLGIQNRLLREYEMPVYTEIMANRKNIRLLDIGCNDGSKTVDRFSDFDIQKVIGIEYYDKLAHTAQARFGNDVFSFYGCDVESDDFADNILEIMRKNSVEKFDVINISFVLLHLKNARGLLEFLKSILATDGKLIIIEADDSQSGISPDGEKLSEEFTDFLKSDPLAGDRECSKQLPKLLKNIGLNEIKNYTIRIEADEKQPSKRRDIFNVFFSYLNEDIKVLHTQYPDNMRYKEAKNWLECNYERMKSLALSTDCTVGMGITIFICGANHNEKSKIVLDEGSEFFMEQLSENDIDTVTQLVDSCVGKGLYSRQHIKSTVKSPNAWIYLLKDNADNLIGYIYFCITNLDDMALFTKTSKSVLSEISDKTNPVIGNIRSLGISEQYRHNRLSVELIRFAVDRMKKLNANVALGAFWKVNEKLPMKDTLDFFEFNHLIDVHKIWYDNKELYCPVCLGRCKCDAALYYKKLEDAEK